MKVVFNDIYGTEIKVSISRSDYIRLDFKGDSFPTKKQHVTGEEIPMCISMKESQASILLGALKDALEELENN